MAVRPILQLGTPSLHALSTPVAADERGGLADAVRDLHDTMAEFQRERGWGRAIAAPQLGVNRRIVCLNIDRPLTLYNPVLDRHAERTMEYWEDCMSFPNLLVRIAVPVACRLRYRDDDWNEVEVMLTDDYAALLQHEVDHLDGVLATQRALDDRSLAIRDTHPPRDLTLRGEFRVVP